MALLGNRRVEIPENRIILLEAENKELRAKCELLETRLDFLAGKVDPLIRDYYAKNQPRTPRAQVRPTYQNSNAPDTHGYFSVKIVYDSYPEGLLEADLKKKVKEALGNIGKNFNPSSFSACNNRNISSGCIRKDNNGLFHYSG